MSLDTISGVLRSYRPPIVFPSLAMMSWELLRNLIVFWRAIDNPLFVRETNHPPMWFPYYARLSRATGLALMLGGMLCYLGTILVLFLNNLLILVIPVLMFWTVLTSITLAPVVVGERERGTWDTLRTTPLDIETILLGKAGGALWWQRDMLRAMIGLLVLFAVGVGLLSLILVPTSDDTAHLPEMLLCGAAILMPALIALVFIFDRAQHFVLTAICVLGISASARSGRVALASAVVVSLLLWLVDVGIAGLLLAVQPGRATLTAETDWLVLAGLGPVVGYLSALPLGKMAVYVAGTLIVRELLVRAAWAWARHLAQGE
jgi:hypothetical protein